MEMYEDPFLKNGLPKNLRIDGTCKTKEIDKDAKNNSLRRVSVKQYNIDLKHAPDSLNHRNESSI